MIVVTSATMSAYPSPLHWETLPNGSQGSTSAATQTNGTMTKEPQNYRPYWYWKGKRCCMARPECRRKKELRDVKVKEKLVL